MSNSLFTIGLMFRAYDNMSSVVASAANSTLNSLGKVQEKFKSLSASAERFGVSAMANGAMLSGAMTKPLQAYADLEEATLGLKSSLMDSFGNIPDQFDEINRQAIALGGTLPGTTADFIGAATALKEQGTGLDTIINGGLRSAANLSVVLRLPAAEAAEMTAKLRESYGLADNELEKMADLVQRAKGAFGMSPQEIKAASAYSGATQNILGLKGIENAKKLLAMQGLGAGVSLEGSSWGTNLAMLLTKTAEAKSKLSKNSKEMKAINADMKSHGFNLEFFNGKGEFMGIDNLVRQLEKTKVLSQEARLNLLHKVFGEEGGRPAAIIAEKGMAGYLDAQKKIDEQANMQQRVAMLTSGIKSQWNSFTDAITNGLAAIGGPIASFLSPAIIALNEFVNGPMMSFIKGHKTIVGVVGTTVLGVGVLAMGLGALGLAASVSSTFIGGGVSVIASMATHAKTAITWIAGQSSALLRLSAIQRMQEAISLRGGAWAALQHSLLLTKYRTLEAIGAGQAWIVTQIASARANLFSIAGLRALGGSLVSSVVSGFFAMTRAAWGFTVALLANPLTWVAAAAIGAGLLIYKYWKPISAFFGGMWDGFVAGMGPLLPSLQAFASSAMAVVSPIAIPLKLVWDWFSRISEQVDDTGGAARNMGVEVGKSLAGAIDWVVKLGTAVFDLVGKFFEAGKWIVNGLTGGLASSSDKPSEATKNIASSMSGGFKNELGIHSPSRVFSGFGQNIGEGLLLGVSSMSNRVKAAAAGLSMTVTGGFGAPVLAAAPLISAPAPIVVREAVQTHGAAHREGSGVPPGMTVVFSPTIHVQGGDGVGQRVSAALNNGYAEFERNMKRFVAEQHRRSF